MPEISSVNIEQKSVGIHGCALLELDGAISEGVVLSAPHTEQGAEQSGC